MSEKKPSWAALAREIKTVADYLDDKYPNGEEQIELYDHILTLRRIHARLQSDVVMAGISSALDTLESLPAAELQRLRARWREKYPRAVQSILAAEEPTCTVTSTCGPPLTPDDLVPMKINCIVNGQTIPVDCLPVDPVWEMRDKALRASSNTGRSFPDWGVRDQAGKELDHRMLVGPAGCGLTTGDTVYISLLFAGCTIPTVPAETIIAHLAEDLDVTSEELIEYAHESVGAPREKPDTTE